MCDTATIGNAPFSLEFAAADLGDVRLNLRLQRIVDFLAEKPAASFPEAMGDVASLEAFYRFINNDRVTSDGILSPHFEETCVRASLARTVLALHDTTEVQYEGEQVRAGLGRISGVKQGYFAHVALAVSADGLREPLGLLGMSTYSRPWQKRTGKAKEQRSKYAQAPDSEALRWPALVDEVEQRATGRFEVIHVMDREADAFGLLGHLTTHDHSFVIRSTHDRKVIADDGAQVQRLGETLACALPVVEREVHLSRRTGHWAADKLRRHPARAARMARLQISATKMDVVATSLPAPTCRRPSLCTASMCARSTLPTALNRSSGDCGRTFPSTRRLKSCTSSTSIARAGSSRNSSRRSRPAAPSRSGNKRRARAWPMCSHC
jgi:Transposase DNA-binding